MKRLHILSRHIGHGLLLLALSAGILIPAPAAVINVSTTSAHVSVGQSFNVLFDVRGLSSAANDSLSGFDLDIVFDPLTVRLLNASFFDPASGTNQLAFSEAGSFGFIGQTAISGGVIDLFGISGNSAGLLDARQNDVFRFVTLTFETLASSPGTFIGVNLADPALLFTDSGAGGLPIAFDNSSVGIAIGPTAVPAPSSFALCMAGMIAILATIRRIRVAILRAGGISIALLTSLAMPAQAQAQTSTSTSTNTTQQQTTPVNQEAIDGVITAIQGQRLQVRLNSGKLVWMTSTTSLSSSHVGKRLTGIAVPAGDGLVLTQARFFN
ncbi:hypothetical protein [Janthinobacterium tructae]|uniref:Cohesin domain-containing protein n=1 Tax=Janthinobacterium tructae TaxID=2590869 RepID=A0A4Y6RBA9_9BURK|nr:hypothetical protein [Janthinobacterium tructae]QDG70153.1 hypothetical protein FJQ89_06780 [Janthinobacterium tructae]